MMIKAAYRVSMTTSTLNKMNTIGENLAKFQINNTEILDFVELIKGAPVSPIALEVLADRDAKEVVRVRAFARVTTDLQKLI